jgi:3-methyladenine DNA glycosylase AlkC
MADALKTFFSPALVRRLAADLVRVHPSFPADAFVATASKGLQRLELLDRGRHIARAMAGHLPGEYRDAIAILIESLGPEYATDELIGIGMAPFFYLPHTLFVAEHGLDDFDLSMRAQYELTKRFSAESSIRPFIAKEPERALTWLDRWAGDANAHVRRLVSEGTRLRLPWAPRVAWLDEHPDRVVTLLERLKDDPASLVRRSVANNLNDLGKVHPALLMTTCRSWLAGATTERQALVEHALRSAVKRGELDALRLLGYGGAAAISIERARVTPRRVPIGGRVSIELLIRSRARTAQQLLVDLAVHFVKANGRTSPKVFKLKRLTLPPRGEAALTTSVSLAIHTTRTPRPGKHSVEVVVNGRTMPCGSFHVYAPSRARRGR